MKKRKTEITRRDLMKGAAVAAASAATISIVPSSVLGGPGKAAAPSDTFGAALIGCGGRGGGTFRDLSKKHGLNIRDLARCDVKYKDKCDNKKIYTDFRRVLERKDIDIIAIATPPHWHALISIAAMQAGKDVVCEKPMTKFIGEGRAVVNAAKRYGRIFQVGTYGRFGMATSRGTNAMTRKLMSSGLLKQTKAVYVHRGGLKVKQWSGSVDQSYAAIPANLDWDMYCGPSPLKPYHSRRVGGTHRGYWDYDSGGLGDMGQHKFDPINFLHGKDNTGPISVETHAPPAHAEVAGMWGWSKLTYADGFQLVIESGEWGEPSGMKRCHPTLDELSAADQEKIKAMPDQGPLVGFGEAVKTRKQAGGHAEAAHRTVCIMHLTNISIRVGRKLTFDPVTEQIIGDEEANRLAYQPMRAPWHL
ncbi:MAG: Gfo/Idh/MocA family oxidoreductase [Phycisphaerae bacterium]|jgi:predicted dehydrogenase|nr:Gfo/Idh/MocA family oxidoreductase [Phycisphaerae bacterium]